MRRSRLERPRLTPQAPQACVSTNSTTPAECIKYTIIFYFFSQYPDCQILKKLFHKSRSVPACAVCVNTNERFVCTCCEFFLTLLLKNSRMFCLNLGLSLRVLFVYTPMNVLSAHAVSFF